MKFTIACLLALAAATALEGRTGGDRVILASDSSKTLQERWNGARGKDRWIGFAIERRMGAGSIIGTYWSDESKNRPSLLEVVTAVRAEPFPSLPGRREGFTRMEGTITFDDDTATVIKEVAILVHYGAAQEEPDDLKVSSMSLHATLAPDPLVWLGSARGRESLPLLTALYRAADAVHLRQKLVMAIGIHQEAGAVFPILSEIAAAAKEPKVRSDALYWISQTKDPAALPFLMKTARDDGSDGVRENAVFAVSELEGEEATDALIALAKEPDRSDVRKKALFWLGQKASRKGAAALAEAAVGDADLAVQKTAVYALAQLPENGGTEPLIRLATSHADPRIRKEAIYQLGQSDDPRALQALVDLVRK